MVNKFADFVFNKYYNKFSQMIKNSISESKYLGKSRNHLIVIEYYRLIFTHLVNFFYLDYTHSNNNNGFNLNEFKEYLLKHKIILEDLGLEESEVAKILNIGLEFIEIEFSFIIEPDIIVEPIPSTFSINKQKLENILKTNCICIDLTKKQYFLTDFRIFHNSECQKLLL